MDFTLLDIQKADIYLIKQLWEENRVFHEQISRYFSYEYSDLIFEERMREILAERRDDDLKITIAKDLPGETVGYGLSVIRDNIGEVCTLFVRKGYRSLGLGKNIMKRHMGWLREKGCHEIVVYVLP